MTYFDGVHLVADTLEELHEFAASINLHRRYFEGVKKGHPHYDLTNKAVRSRALESGAQVVSSRFILKKAKSLSKK